MSNLRRWLTVAAAAALAAATYFLLPDTVNELARRTAAIFVVAVVFWASEVIPLFATSLLLIGFEIVFLAGAGGTALLLPTRCGAALENAPPYETFLNPFASGVIILFMGGFLLSAAVTKHGLDQQIAARLLKPFARRPATLLFAVMGITAFFSMWMSNTATAVMMIAVIRPLLDALPDDDRFQKGLVLSVAFAANIGGIGTPIGTPPNAVALAALNQQFPDLALGFAQWMLMAVPLAVILLAATGFLLLLLFRPSAGATLPTLDPPTQRITLRGKATLLILTGAVFLWVFSGPLGIGLGSAAVALLAAAALTTVGALDRGDVDSIDWNILILMWGGLALGEAMQVSGLVDLIAGLPFDTLSTGWLVVMVVVAGAALSTFMSNTAAANVLVPSVIAVGLALPDADAGRALALQLAVMTALACSFAMAFPVSTPPNAVAFATGRVPTLSMIEAGGLVTLGCLVLLLAGYRLVLPWALGGI